MMNIESSNSVMIIYMLRSSSDGQTSSSEMIRHIYTPNGRSTSVNNKLERIWKETITSLFEVPVR
jgi:hypothetical protein